MTKKTIDARIGDFVHHVNGLIAQGVNPLELRDILKDLDSDWVGHYKDCANQYNYDCAIERGDKFDAQFHKYDGVPT